jgi:hypothetical protein
MDHEMSIQKRDKIADVMRGAERMGCTSHPTFRAAFPQIEAIHVEVEYTRIGHVSAWPSGTVVYSSLDNLSRFLDCRNPVCYGGGVDLNDVIMWMVFDHKTEYHDDSRCRGYEGSPKGRTNYGPCNRRFKVSVTLTYKPEDSGDSGITTRGPASINH